MPPPFCVFRWRERARRRRRICPEEPGLETPPGYGASTASAWDRGRGGGWDVHSTGGDGLFTVRAVLLQLHGVSARRVPWTGSRAHEGPAPCRQRAHHETETTPALGERVRSARWPLRVELARLSFAKTPSGGKRLIC